MDLDELPGVYATKANPGDDIEEGNPLLDVWKKFAKKYKYLLTR